MCSCPSTCDDFGSDESSCLAAEMCPTSHNGHCVFSSSKRMYWMEFFWNVSFRLFVSGRLQWFKRQSQWVSRASVFHHWQSKVMNQQRNFSIVSLIDVFMVLLVPFASMIQTIKNVTISTTNKVSANVQRLDFNHSWRLRIVWLQFECNWKMSLERSRSK